MRVLGYSSQHEIGGRWRAGPLTVSICIPELNTYALPRILCAREEHDDPRLRLLQKMAHDLEEGKGAILDNGAEQARGLETERGKQAPGRVRRNGKKKTKK